MKWWNKEVLGVTPVFGYTSISLRIKEFQL